MGSLETEGYQIWSKQGRTEGLGRSIKSVSVIHAFEHIIWTKQIIGKLPSRCKIRNQKTAKGKLFFSQSNRQCHLEETNSCSLLCLYDSHCIGLAKV